jgi:hypothetical protein
MTGTQDFIEIGEVGKINWSKNYVDGEGSAPLDTIAHPSITEARLFAQMEAEKNAIQNLEEVVSGILMEKTVSVKGMLSTSDENSTQVKSLIKNAKSAGPPDFSGGVCKVVKRIPIYQNGLAKILVDDALSLKQEVFKNPFIHLDTSAAHGHAVVPSPLPTQIMLWVEGLYQPAIFPLVTTDNQHTYFDFSDRYHSTSKVPSLVKVRPAYLNELKSKKGTAILSVVQDNSGNLVLSEESQRTCLSWKTQPKVLMGLVKSILVGI